MNNRGVLDAIAVIAYFAIIIGIAYAGEVTGWSEERTRTGVKAPTGMSAVFPTATGNPR